MRYDHTSWLMHFVRDRKPDQDFPGETEEEFSFYVGGELDVDASAFEVLRNIVRVGGIIPGYSFRNGRTTIYGGSPAVCATEMPLYSFAQYAKQRNDSSMVSAYGIAFLKSEFYKSGGRPAIYGLSSSNINLTQDEYNIRLLSDDVLPQQEQYRYVAYNPSNVGKWVDWSHEREWRWIAKDHDKDEVWVTDHNGVYGSTPALPLFKGSLDGGAFTKLCIIVWNHEEAARINEDLTSFYLAGSNNYDTPFDQNLISNSKIIVLEDVIKAVESGQIEAQTIEGLDAAKLLSPITIAQPPQNAAAIVKAAMAKAGQAAKNATAAFAAKNGLGAGWCGFAHATTREVTHPIVQYLLSTGEASGPFDGRVWINYPRDYPRSSSLDYEAAGCAAAAEELSKALGVKVYVEERPD